MVYLTITPTMLRALEVLDSHFSPYICASDETEPSLAEPVEGNPISHRQIIELSKKLKQSRTENRDSGTEESHVSYHLDDLLRGSRIYVEPPKPKVQPVRKLSLEPQLPTDRS